jgi:hypothetical protein
MATRKIVTKNINTTVAAYVGQDGELFYDTVTNTLKISDGTTAGGATVVTDGTGTSGLTGVGTAGTPRLAADYAVAVGSFSAINSYAVNLGVGAGNAAAGYSINAGFQAGELAVDSYNTRIGFEAGRYGSSASFGVAIGFKAGVTVVGTSSDAVVSGTSFNVGTGTGFAVGQYLNTLLPSPPYFFDNTYILSGTSPNFVLSEAAQENGTGAVQSYGKYPGGVIINGASGNLPAVNTGFYLKPVRDGGSAAGMSAAGFKPCYYNPTTGEFVYSSS